MHTPPVYIQGTVTFVHPDNKNLAMYIIKIITCNRYIYTYVHVCMYVCVYVCMYLRIYVCMHVHTYAYNLMLDPYIHDIH